jgi:hypothetical protein
MAIGIGTKNFDAKTVKEANGEAFINAAFAFDHYLKKQTITIKTPRKEIDEEVNISLSLDLLSLDN